MGLARQPMDEAEILKRCLYGMVNEGARLLEQGVALRPSDIDITYLTGYGFPAHHGGPMYLADRIGLDQVLADIRRFHTRDGFWWQPAPLLEKLVAEGKRFADLQPQA
jgi:3-hydroxyacyl-CoA dehydrogenase